MDFDANYGVVIHQDFIPLYADDKYAKIFGYHNAKEILALDSILQLIDPEQQDVAAHTYYALMSGMEKPQVRNYVNRNRSGILMNVLAIEHIVEWQGRPALQITIVDVTESHVLKCSLQQSEQRYQQLINNVFEGVFIHRDFTPLFCNKALCELLGFPNQNAFLSQQSMLQIVATEDQQRLIEATTRLLQSKNTPEPMEIHCLHQNGTSLRLKLVESLISWQGEDAVQVSVFDMTESYRLKEKLDQLIYQDFLTNVLNRRGFMHFARQLAPQKQPKNKCFYCLIIGMDDLKQINHLYGYSVGDIALVQFAKHCKKKLAETDLISRWSGDEFIAMIQATNHQAARQVAEHIRHFFNDTELVDPETKKPINFSTSIGYAQWQEDEELDTLILRADSALELARSQITEQLVFA
ncbi:sensor domain-containing diguanylate cyclase [Shewanella sp.]|uniref:sensor domain-containing diguanylate cyclase n=1 Tax=Shewanella sp. TaxID=50422 RepID=UPI004047D68C